VCLLRSTIKLLSSSSSSDFSIKLSTRESTEEEEEEEEEFFNHCKNDLKIYHFQPAPRQSITSIRLGFPLKIFD